ncbi:MAG: hypothetical protein ABIY55_03000 [Kofleriaceae bacterium]
MSALLAADWPLAFRATQPVTIEACAGALAVAVGGPVAVAISSLSGNPRDGYDRTVHITGNRPGDELRLELALLQSMRGPDDPETHTALCGCTLHAPTATFATRLAAWAAVRDALAAIACADCTLTWRPAPIVDAAEAAGDTAMVDRLRAEITAALVAEAPSCRHVTLMSTRADLEAVLAAYVDPQDISNVCFDDCSLSALPTGVARHFPNVENLSWTDDGIDGHALCGVVLPKLDRLHLQSSALRRVRRADLAGFPRLTELILLNNPLEDLAPEIIEACPMLRRVVITNTPVAGDAFKLAALRARWQGVVWA